ncbi:MAG: enoyl-CoA hydratase/isomerase family protein [Betaproteobacteria bacterium]|nr:enoyl-CoA hydratase/isomerase family protein [Betaproteobacteria bacterium]
MSAAADTVILERRGAIARLTFTRADSGNALRGADMLLLATLFRQCLADPEIRVITLSGRGPKFFCAGADIAELASGLPDIGVHIRKWHEVVDLIEASEKPVIAAINGVAVGGGLELALACHQRIAVAGIRLGLPELKVGLFPAAGGVRRLTRLIGAAQTLDLVMSTELITAEAAQQKGIIDQVCPAAEFHDTVQRVAERIAEFEPNAVRAVLACARTSALGIDSNDLVVSLLRECYATPRNREVLQGFMSRRRSGSGKPK